MDGELAPGAEPLQVPAEDVPDPRERLLVRRRRLEDEPPGLGPDDADAVGEEQSATLRRTV